MSRVGRKVIPIPKDVKVQIEKSSLQVQGPKGKLTTPGAARHLLQAGRRRAHREPDQRRAAAARVPRPGPRAGQQRHRRRHHRASRKELDIVGVGFKANVEGNKVVFALGYSHPVIFPIPEGIKVAVDAEGATG